MTNPTQMDDDVFGTGQIFINTLTGKARSGLVALNLSGFLPSPSFYTAETAKKLFDLGLNHADSSTQAAAFNYLRELLMPRKEEMYYRSKATQLGQAMIRHIGPKIFSEQLFALVANHQDEFVVRYSKLALNTGIQVAPQEVATAETVRQFVDLACDSAADQNRREAAFETVRQAIEHNAGNVVDAYLVQKLSSALESLTSSSSGLAHNDRRILRDICETLEAVADHKPEMVQSLIAQGAPQRLADVASNSEGEFSSKSVGHLAHVLKGAEISVGRDSLHPAKPTFPTSELG